MVLQILTSVIYDIVQHSWTTISIAAKYYILGVIGYLYINNRFSLEDFSEKIISDSRFVISLTVLAGTSLYVSGINVSPLVKLVSEVVALAYLGYLFWEY